MVLLNVFCLSTMALNGLVPDNAVIVFTMAGWASISSSSTVYKMVMSIGWNPFYKNKEKTAEPWLLHTFEEVQTIGVCV